jgi:hypothetical protein
MVKTATMGIHGFNKHAFPKPRAVTKCRQDLPQRTRSDLSEPGPKALFGIFLDIFEG